MNRAVPVMEGGPPGSPIRRRSQTTASCCGQEPWWWALRKRPPWAVRCAMRRRTWVNHCWRIETGND